MTLVSARARKDQLSKAFGAMTEEALYCRRYGHSWKPWDVFWLPGRKGLDEKIRCSNCSTVRHNILTRFGDIISSNYLYPSGYLVPELGRLTPADRGQLRLATIAKAQVRETPDA